LNKGLVDAAFPVLIKALARIPSGRYRANAPGTLFLPYCSDHSDQSTKGSRFTLNGMYWIDQHVRGSASRGISLKDYRVKL
jgi:hypothetical protein